MRMTIYKFVTQEVDDIHYIIMLFFLAYLGIEKDMKQHITEFLRQFVFIACENGSIEFIHLFNGLRAKRLVGLLTVPRTFFPQFIEDVQNASECL